MAPWETSWKSVQGEFVQVLHVDKSHWLTVRNKHCPPGTTCVYDSTEGAVTADTKNQVMGCRLCQNPTFHEDIILDGYLEKRMWTFAKCL